MHTASTAEKVNCFKRLLQLRFDCDLASIRLRHSYQNYDSIAIRLRRKMNMFIFRRIERHRSQKKAVDGAYNDVTVSVTVIRMTFTAFSR